MFFFDGNKVADASYKAIQIGSYWVDTIVGNQLATTSTAMSGSMIKMALAGWNTTMKTNVEY